MITTRLLHKSSPNSQQGQCLRIASGTHQQAANKRGTAAAQERLLSLLLCLLRLGLRLRLRSLASRLLLFFAVPSLLACRASAPFDLLLSRLRAPESRSRLRDRRRSRLRLRERRNCLSRLLDRRISLRRPLLSSSRWGSRLRDLERRRGLASRLLLRDLNGRVASEPLIRKSEIRQISRIRG